MENRPNMMEQVGDGETAKDRMIVAVQRRVRKTQPSSALALHAVTPALPDMWC